MQYHFKIHKERAGGFWAECIELSGCQSEGDTREQLEKNLKEALNLYLDEPMSSTVLFPLPKKSIKQSSSIIKMPVDPHIAFAFLLRLARFKAKKKQRELAQSLNFKSLNAYQKLESSRTANPELKTMYKLKAVLPHFRIDLIWD